MVSVSRVYAPNEYSVYLSPNDREQFSSYEESLVNELQEYLGEHAKRESYVLLSSPKVLMNTDSDLEVGEFGIATRMVQPEPGQDPPSRCRRRRRPARRWSTSHRGRDAGRDARGARRRA